MLVGPLICLRRRRLRRDCRHQRPNANDVHDTRQVIGKHAERHLSCDLWQRLHEEVGGPHPRFDGPEGVLDRLASDTHGFWGGIEPLLYSLKDMLMLPSWNTARPRRALRFELTGPAPCGPITAHRFSVFLVGEAISEPLARRAAVEILFGGINEVLFAEAAFCLGA